MPLRDGMLSVWRGDVSLVACYILGVPNCSSTVLGSNHEHNIKINLLVFKILPLGLLY